MNDFLEAINNSKNDSEASDTEDEDPSRERYNEVKQEEADVEKKTPAEKRYNRLKEETKKELVESNEEASDEEQDEDEGQEGFITH
ncbi:hypothetical protein ACK3SF_04640 [Candidatus Nanosalina sp. VS9-1]|uniref:hypothetical protein n=1 Tax=Candidatus Nanosalina sp. VS9-1 TaxID=3388566 RepID=UPI0039E13C11